MRCDVVAVCRRMFVVIAAAACALSGPAALAGEGRCCFGEGRDCRMDLTPEQCANFGGQFQPGLSCPPDGQCSPTGACCTPTGCTITSFEQCSGQWIAGAPCSACPSVPTGACCTGASCQVTTQASCTGTWTPNIACGANTCRTGACCQGTGCVITIEAQCESTWYPDGQCAPFFCTDSVGACCQPDGRCVVINAFNCAGQWTQGATCQPDPCAAVTGACCIEDQCLVLTSGECEESEGRFVGYGVPCTPLSPCDPQNLGACCTPAGCFVTVELSCVIITDAEFQGLGTTCAPPACGQPVIGACCLFGGGCVVGPQSSCTAGTFIANGQCSPSPCPTGSGACCTEEGCRIVSAAACSSLEGEFNGNGSTCEPDPCQGFLLGACCAENGACEITTQTICGATFRSFRGGGSVCGTEENPIACCPANFNQQNGVTVQDIYDFLSAWSQSDAAADFNGQNGVTVQDIYDFLSAWSTGC